MHWLPTLNGLRRADGRRSRCRSSPPAVRYCVDARLHVGVRVSREDGDPGALARGVGHDLVPLKQEAKIDDPQHHEQQRGEDERELDELGAALARPQLSRRLRLPSVYLSHSVTIVPARIGTAYASRGPRLCSSVISGSGLTPFSRQ